MFAGGREDKEGVFSQQDFCPSFNIEYQGQPGELQMFYRRKDESYDFVSW